MEIGEKQELGIKGREPNQLRFTTLRIRKFNIVSDDTVISLKVDRFLALPDFSRGLIKSP